MGDAQATDSSDGIDGKPTFPRAVIHKRILSVAESRPDAPMEAIAESVSGATTSLVEQVLDKYGDPGGTPADEAASATEDAEPTAATEQESTATADDDSIPDQSAMSDHSSGTDDSTVDPEAVTAKQLETLREIRDRPRATQAELADRLGVSGATISQRVNGIDGFDWSERRAFVDRFFDRQRAAGEAGDAETDDAEAGTAATTDDGSDNTATTNNAADEPVTDANAAVGTGTADAAGNSLETRTAHADTALGDGGDASTEDSSTSPEGAYSTTAEDPTDGTSRPANHEEPNATDGAAMAEATATETQSSPRGRSDAALADRVAELTARVETLEERLATEYSVDPALAHKVIHVCIQSDQISEEEEVRILEGILAADGPGRRTAADASSTADSN